MDQIWAFLFGAIFFLVQLGVASHLWMTQRAIGKVWDQRARATGAAEHSARVQLSYQLTNIQSRHILKRLSVMAPLVGVVLTAVGFLTLPVGSTSGDSSQQFNLQKVQPLYIGVLVGAALALINQIFLAALEMQAQSIRGKLESGVHESPESAKDAVVEMRAALGAITNEMKLQATAMRTEAAVTMAELVRPMNSAASSLLKTSEDLTRVQVALQGAATRFDTSSKDSLRQLDQTTDAFGKALDALQTRLSVVAAELEKTPKIMQVAVTSFVSEFTKLPKNLNDATAKVGLALDGLPARMERTIKAMESAVGQFASIAQTGTSGLSGLQEGADNLKQGASLVLEKAVSFVSRVDTEIGPKLPRLGRAFDDSFKRQTEVCESTGNLVKVLNLTSAKFETAGDMLAKEVDELRIALSPIRALTDSIENALISNQKTLADAPARINTGLESLGSAMAVLVSEHTTRLRDDSAREQRAVIERFEGSVRPTLKELATLSEGLQAVGVTVSDLLLNLQSGRNEQESRVERLIEVIDGFPEKIIASNPYLSVARDIEKIEGRLHALLNECQNSKGSLEALVELAQEQLLTSKQIEVSSTANPRKKWWLW